MNRCQKKVLTLAGAIANLSLTCAVAGVATYAWFSYNNTVFASNMSIKSVDRELIIDKYTILKYNDDQKKGVAYENNSSQFFLPDYDEYIKARNVYSNIVVRVELRFTKGLDTSKQAVEIDVKRNV